MSYISNKNNGMNINTDIDIDTDINIDIDININIDTDTYIETDTNINTNININTATDIDKLNHPWFIYPHAFMSEYNDYELYKSESIRLNLFLEDFLNKLYSKNFDSSKILIPIILGSTMEDSLIGSHTNITNIFQFQQLFPNYIDNFIKNEIGNKYIQMIIISPDKIFQKDDYVPLFVKFSKYKFKKNNKFEFLSESDELMIKINIFNCPMVTEEKRKNIIINCDNILNDFKINMSNKNIFNTKQLVSTYVQSQSDLLLIKNIYKNIEKIFSLTNTFLDYSNNFTDNDNNNVNYKINVVVNSWVSFKNLCGYSENYKMFPELLKLSSKYNIIATDWEYIDENCICIIKSDYHFGNDNYKFKKIIYTNYKSDYESDIIEKIKPYYNNDVFMISFINNNLLEKVI